MKKEEIAKELKRIDYKKRQEESNITKEKFLNHMEELRMRKQDEYSRVFPNKELIDEYNETIDVIEPVINLLYDLDHLYDELNSKILNTRVRDFILKCEKLESKYDDFKGKL